MTVAVVADTHALIWYLSTGGRLSDAARRALDLAAASGAQVGLSAITLVELVYLAEKGRIPRAAVDRLHGELARPEAALAVVPLDAQVAAAVAIVPRAAIPDMPDRIIAATAIHLGVPLVTRMVSSGPPGSRRSGRCSPCLSRLVRTRIVGVEALDIVETALAAFRVSQAELGAPPLELQASTPTLARARAPRPRRATAARRPSRPRRSGRRSRLDQDRSPPRVARVWGAPGARRAA